MDVFVLWHVYEKNHEDLYDETKILGVYSSEEKAREAIERYKDLPGFNEFNEACYEICKSKVNRLSWKDGFIKEYW